MPIPALAGFSALAIFLGNVISKLTDFIFRKAVLHVLQLTLFFSIVYASLSSVFLLVTEAIRSIAFPQVVSDSFVIVGFFIPDNAAFILQSFLSIEAAIFIARWLWFVAWRARARI